jgi:hypothetical protein
MRIDRETDERTDRYDEDLSLKIGPTGRPETSVSNQLTHRNNPEDRKIQFNRCGCLRCRKLVSTTNEKGEMLEGVEI